MNRMLFQDLVKGQYGRKIAYTDVSEITESNIVSVVGSCVGAFNFNKPIFKYLWDYKNGDQPALYRRKTVRDDVNNKVVENHAWEIVRFKNGQTYGEPVQFVSLVKDDKINQAVDRLNNYMRVAGKATKDINSGEWTSAVGTGFKAVQRTASSANIPFRIVAPTPMNTFIIYSRTTEEPLLAVQELKDENGEWYKLCFSETHEFQIKNGALIALDEKDGIAVKSRLHAFGGIPIVEYPNNQDRLSDIELVITMLDAINNMQSNRMDAIEQFVQSWVKFVNCEVDKNSFLDMKMAGALVVKSNNGSDNKADVDIMTQELNQTESQVAKEDLWNNVLSISAIPNKQSNTGGDTQGAVELRNGWDFSKQAAKLKDPYIVEADKRLAMVALNIIRIEKGKDDCPLDVMDFDVQINHSPTDNMQVKAQVLQLLLTAGIHPLIAIKVCGLWGDSEKVYLLSKPYLDVLHKTIDQVVEDAAEQEKKAKELLEQKMKQGNAGEK